MEHIGSVGFGFWVMPIIALIMLLVQAAVMFAIVYFATRLAIRHERRPS
jgi:hypothetical protein